MSDIEEIYRDYFKDVFLFLRGLCRNENLSEEIAQETFVKALSSIDRYNEETDIRAWLFTIAKNTYYTYCRRKNISIEEMPREIDRLLEENERLEEKLKQEYETDKMLIKLYDDLDDYINYMEESIDQYKDLKKEVDNFTGNLKEFVNTLEFGYTNYEEDNYVDFNWGNLTCSVYLKENKLVLGDLVELWNDREYALINNSFNITEYLVGND